ncbi:DUF2777 domain-containing protein [Halalkalibacterium halodurans]|uniref:DUF2777 domain-containing protein n=1 Tax=Halalkalibacterium halodurans TaxID=86665 RepID=UPI0010FDA01F|nr:DUF2777 domain-containing protein [Halalkalibacterium halodurans]
MNRKEAKALIGKPVILDKGQQGVYIGELKQVIAEPGRPWRGQVKIREVVQFPHIDLGSAHTPLPIYENGELVEVAGSRLTAAEEEDRLPFETSLKQAAAKTLAALRYSQQQGQKHIEAIDHYLQQQGVTNSSSQEEDRFIYYTCLIENDRPFLVDGEGQHLELEGCPFEFEWKTKDGWIPVQYAGDQTFTSKGGRQFRLRENSAIRLEKIQLDPYYILRNELEKQALLAFEKGLADHGVTHQQMVHCHNSLLFQLLQSNHQPVQAFSGVNFLSYLTPSGLLVVQHHYDRKLVKNGKDEVYDRFEFTTDQGTRSIATYTNEFSK